VSMCTVGDTTMRPQQSISPGSAL